MYGSMSAYKKRIGYSPTGSMFADNFDRGPVAEVNNDAGLAWGANWQTASGLNWSYDAEVLADLASLYLKFGEASGAAAVDSSGNGLNGAYQNAPTLGVAGPIAASTAVQLNGTTQYISVADAALLDPGDNVTIEGWVRLTALGAIQVILDKDTSGYVAFVGGTGFVSFQKSNVLNLATSTVAIAATVWTHVVATKAGAAVKIYINGVDVTGTVTNATILPTASPLNIGRTVGGTLPLNGAMARVALYPTALSAARVLAHYNASLNANGGGAWGFYSINASNQAVIGVDVWPGTWSVTRFKNSGVFDRGYFVEFTFRQQAGVNGEIGFLIDAQGPASLANDLGVFYQNVAGTNSIHTGAGASFTRTLVDGEVVRARINPTGTLLIVSINGVDVLSKAYVATPGRYVGVSQSGGAGSTFTIAFDNFRAGLL